MTNQRIQTKVNLPSALLEQWLREHYFNCRIDIASSGVESYSVGEIRQRLGISEKELDRVLLCDSPTLGNTLLREAIARRWANGCTERVMATHGSTEALHLVLHSMLEPNDEIVVLDPTYYFFTMFTYGLGCRLVRWRLRFEDGFVPDLDLLKRVITPATKMVIVNFPHNPTGATLTESQLTALVEVIAVSGAYLLWDSAFSLLTYDAPPLPDPTEFYERTISIGTLSKAYGLAGLRVGWCIGPPEVLSRCVHVRDYTTLCLSPLVELLAARAIEKSEFLILPRLERARANRKIVDAWIRQSEGRVEWVRPSGGVCGFVRFNEVADVTDLCRTLAQISSVLLVPGECFGCPEFARLGFGGPTPALLEGLNRLSAQLHIPEAEFSEETRSLPLLSVKSTQNS